MVFTQTELHHNSWIDVVWSEQQKVRTNLGFSAACYPRQVASFSFLRTLRAHFWNNKHWCSYKVSHQNQVSGADKGFLIEEAPTARGTPTLSVADPGFPRREGAPTRGGSRIPRRRRRQPSRRGAPAYKFARFSEKLTDPKNILVRGGGGRGPTPEFVTTTYYLTRYLPKTTWKWKKLNREGCHASLAPPSPFHLSKFVYKRIFLQKKQEMASKIIPGIVNNATPPAPTLLPSSQKYWTRHSVFEFSFFAQLDQNFNLTKTSLSRHRKFCGGIGRTRERVPGINLHEICGHCDFGKSDKFKRLNSCKTQTSCFRGNLFAGQHVLDEHVSASIRHIVRVFKIQVCLLIGNRAAMTLHGDV